MDMTKRQALISKIAQQELAGQSDPTGGNDHYPPLPVVSLEDFFDGNDDYGSIGCNLLENEHPGPLGFYSALKTVRDRPEVQDVLVEVYEVEDDQWPFSERVYVLTSATQNDVAQWLEALSPDEIEEGMPWSRPHSMFPALSPDIRIYTAWWD